MHLIFYNGSESEVGAPPKKNMMQLVMKIFASVFTGGGLGVMVVYAGETGLWLESQETVPWWPSGRKLGNSASTYWE